MELIQFTRETIDAIAAQKIIELENTAWHLDAQDAIFPSEPNTYLTSFVLMEGDKAICHVGIRKSMLYHKGQEYLAYGLSEVVTHPHYQKRGLASRVIELAAQFILSQPVDISIFTCAPQKVAFYARGGWEATEGACFVGGTAEKPFRSDSLHLVTMMRFISPKGREHRKDFENTDIVFELGENQLW